RTRGHAGHAGHAGHPDTRTRRTPACDTSSSCTIWSSTIEGGSPMSDFDASSPSIACALCGTALPPGSSRTVNGHPACLNCALQVQRELAAQAATSAGMLPALVLGLVGALIGAAVWAAIAAAAHLAIGYVAVLVGFLAGLGVKIGAGAARGKPLQILAAGLA